MALPPENIIHIIAESTGLTCEVVRNKFVGLDMFSAEWSAITSVIVSYAVAKAKEADELKCSVGELSAALQDKDKEIAKLERMVAVRDAKIEEKESLLNRFWERDGVFWAEKSRLETECKEIDFVMSDVAPARKNKLCISLKALALRIGYVMNSLGSKAEENIRDRFEKGFDHQWLSEFWGAFYTHQDWVLWLTDGSELKSKQFLMVIGKLMSLCVFKNNVPKMSKCFNFPATTNETKSRYLNLGINELAVTQPEMNTWIEQYVDTHLAS